MYVLLCRVYRLIKNERSGVSPSLSSKKLSELCIFCGLFVRNEVLPVKPGRKYISGLNLYFRVGLHLKSVLRQYLTHSLPDFLSSFVRNVRGVTAKVLLCTCFSGCVASEGKRSGESPSLSANGNFVALCIL